MSMAINMRRWLSSIPVAVGLLLLMSAPVHGAETKDIVDAAAAAGQFNTLVAAVKAAGLVETLKGTGPFTVFAPTDAAFSKLPAGTVEDLLKPQNKAKLTAILTYHVVGARVMSDALVAGPASIRTVGGTALPMSYALHVNGADVVKADILCSNGVIHVIDAVLLPPDSSATDIVETAVASGQFNTLVAAVKAAGLSEALKSDGPFTVFAPTDEAFAKLPAGMVEDLLKPENRGKLQSILKYHVVPGKLIAADVVELESTETLQGGALDIKVAEGGVMVGGANVVKADIACSNGLIHVIDGVLVPPPGQARAEALDIVDTAVAAGQFKTLVAAVEAAGLVDTLKGAGPLTVFAPTDEAFAKLPAGAIESLLKPENKDKLAAVLTYHVVSGQVMAAKLLLVKSTRALNGGLLTFGLTVKPDDATVTKADIACSNGVVHVIDAVLLPAEDRTAREHPAAEHPVTARPKDHPAH